MSNTNHSTLLGPVTSEQPKPESYSGSDPEQESENVFLSSVTVAEIAYGLASLPEGRKRRRLRNAFEEYLSLGFAERNLDFSLEAARVYGVLMAQRKSEGHPMSMADGQIAAIAKVHKMAIATRNVKDFTGCDLKIINPFDLGSGPE